MDNTPGGDVFGIESKAAPGAVNIAGGQLIVYLFLFDDLGFECPAQEFGDGDSHLDIKAPQSTVGGVDHGKGIGINADNEGFILRDGEIIQRSGIPFKGDS